MTKDTFDIQYEIGSSERLNNEPEMFRDTLIEIGIVADGVVSAVPGGRTLSGDDAIGAIFTGRDTVSLWINGVDSIHSPVAERFFGLLAKAGFSVRQRIYNGDDTLVASRVWIPSGDDVISMRWDGSSMEPPLSSGTIMQWATCGSTQNERAMNDWQRKASIVRSDLPSLSHFDAGLCAARRCSVN